MQKTNGHQRVVIENVYPEIDCGRFAIKRIVNEPVTIRADVYAEGHDEVKAALLYRQKGKRKWQEIPMTFLGNDRWEASFTPQEVNYFEYTIQGWVDHFSTWQHDLEKKFEAGQDVGVELLIGAQYIEEAAKKAKGREAKKLQSWAEELEHPVSSASEVSLVLSEEVTQMMQKWGEHSEVSSYPKNLLLRVDRQKAGFSAWYEFFPRSATPKEGRHGTFKDCEKVLPEIAKMGFDVVYFPPIHPIGQSYRKGKNNSVTAQPGEPGSPWAIGSKEGGHKAIHPELGTMEDFKRLINVANDLGIEIALDFAIQCSQDHPYVKEHSEWFKWRPDGTIQYAENPPKKYQDVVPVNFETEDWKNLWDELKSIVDFWIDKGVKIFRVDNPHTKPFVFWEWLITNVRKENPDVIFLAEAFTRPRIMEQLAKLGFHQSYTYYTWRNTRSELREYMEYLTQTEVREYFRPNFWPNTPDINPPILQHNGEAAFITRFVMAATLSSNYGMYGPVFEKGISEAVTGKEEYLNSEKYEIKSWNWEEKTNIKRYIIAINDIRRHNPALQNTSNIRFLDTNNDFHLAYLKYDHAFTNFILVIVNMDLHYKQSGWVRIPLDFLQIPTQTSYSMKDLLNDTTYTWQNDWNYVELDPGSKPVHVFRIEK